MSFLGFNWNARHGVKARDGLQAKIHKHSGLPVTIHGPIGFYYGKKGLKNTPVLGHLFYGFFPGFSWPTISIPPKVDKAQPVRES